MSFGELARRAVRRLRGNASLRAARREAQGAIRQIRELKASHPGRTVCGILLVEHIGDIIACEPVVGWIRRTVPDAFVVWVVRDAYRELLVHHPGVDAAIEVSSLALVAPIVRSGAFDVCFDMHINRKPTGRKNLDHVKGWGDPGVDGLSYFRHGTILRAFSKAAGIPSLSGAPQLHVPPDVVRAVDAIGLPARFVVVHTTSNDEAKNWSPDAWLEVVRHILDTWQLPVIEVGLTDSIHCRDQRFISLCGRISILETAEVIRRSQFFVGVDSAGAHMANVWRIPSLLLFGQYKGEDAWTPYEGFFAEEPDRWILRQDGSLRSQSAARGIERPDTLARFDGEVGQGPPAPS